MPPKRSRLAKENDITNKQESEIREAFDLFSFPDPEDEGKSEVLKLLDVRRCLTALGVKLKPEQQAEIKELLDPDNKGYVEYERFLGYAAVYVFHDPNRTNEAEDEKRRNEIQEAFALFTNGHSGPINLRDLRRVAKTLKQDVSDDVLRDMLSEANGDRKNGGWQNGVTIEEFESVMTRAGLFGDR